MRNNPNLYEINAQIFIRRLSEKYGQPLTLATVPTEEWQTIARLGLDCVWLMGVWQRSQASRQEALHTEFLRELYNATLPGWTDADVGGSPYAIAGYTLDSALGAPGDLARIKGQLNKMGIRLILDFVPNHLARDHAWTHSHPEWFVRGGQNDVRAHPERFFSPDGNLYLAHGRDPYFPPWTDTVQVNFFSSEARQALINELLRITEVADGVRCDMAMLALNSVFQRIWGDIVKGPPLEHEFWAEAIPRIKQKQPDFLFLAEAYWGLEPELLKLGFDFTYDKTFYDQLCAGAPRDIRTCLEKDSSYMNHQVHFIENHDEPRAIATLGWEKSLAAAIIMMTIPGMRLFHDGQLDGRKMHIPIQLIREPGETADIAVRNFYQHLLEICQDTLFHDGNWVLLETKEAWNSDEKYHNLLAWSWWQEEQFKLVVVNYSAEAAQGWLQLPSLTTSAECMILRDELTGALYVRNVSELRTKGLYIGLGPWQAHIMGIVSLEQLDMLLPADVKIRQENISKS